MKRLINYDLQQWKTSTNRKPLLMRGARQVGKTHAVRYLGQSFTSFLEVNFEKQPQYIEVFERDLDPKRIVSTLIAMTSQQITPGQTLLFFDEIQACPKAITALRYFYEEMPELHVIGAGSLLDFAIEKVGVPVGRVSYCHVYPVSFMEFLAAKKNIPLFNLLMSHQNFNPLQNIIHEKLFELLGQYMLLGGMPEVIALSLENIDATVASRLQHAIVNTYRDDFPKYTKKLQVKYVEAVFNQVPHLLCQSFKYSHIHGDYQKRELAPAIELLVKAGIVHKIYESSGNGVPLGAEANFERFKLFFIDVALAQAMLSNNAAQWLLHPMDAFVNKGFLTESFVGQELLCYLPGYARADLYYWHRDKRGSNAEVDYLIQLGHQVVPIEVKSGKNSSLKSLHMFLEEKSNSPYGVRFSILNFSALEKLHSYPLYGIANLLIRYDAELKKRLNYLLISHS